MQASIVVHNHFRLSYTRLTRNLPWSSPRHHFSTATNMSDVGVEDSMLLCLLRCHLAAPRHTRCHFFGFPVRIRKLSSPTRVGTTVDQQVLNYDITWLSR